MNTTITAENVDMLLTNMREMTARANAAEQENEILGKRVDELIHHLNINEGKIKELVWRLDVANSEIKDLTAAIERDKKSMMAVFYIQNEILSLDGRIRDLRGLGGKLHASLSAITSKLPHIQNRIARVFSDEDQQLAKEEAENE